MKKCRKTLKKLKKSKSDSYLEIINDLICRHNIEHHWSKKGDPDPDSSNGYAWWSTPEDRVIKIPRPTNIYNFFVCLHEIAHCIKGTRRLSHLEEYIAEEWAIKKAAEYGFQSTFYEKEAAKLLLRYVNSDIKQGLIHKSDIKPEIKKFITKRGIKYELCKMR